MEESHQIAFQITIDLEDTIYTDDHSSEDYVQQIATDEKKRIIELVKDCLRQTTYQVSFS
jgi:hypothetical protein